MTIELSPEGIRTLHFEVEVAATPERTWDLVATSQGISSWFVPTEVDGREGGAISFQLGDDPEALSIAVITEWEPPYRFAYLEQIWMQAEASAFPVVTEFVIEPRFGDGCTLVMASSAADASGQLAEAFEQMDGEWGKLLDSIALLLRRR
mgnify:CR=1 FL=1